MTRLFHQVRWADNVRGELTDKVDFINLPNG